VYTVLSRSGTMLKDWAVSRIGQCAKDPDGVRAQTETRPPMDSETAPLGSHHMSGFGVLRGPARGERMRVPYVHLNAYGANRARAHPMVAFARLYLLRAVCICSLLAAHLAHAHRLG